MPTKIREGNEILVRGKVKVVDGTNITLRSIGYSIPITMKSDEPSIVSVGKPDVKRPRDDMV
jgi:hypothetical protein